MDRELVTYLDRRFAENEETTRRIVEETTRRIVDQRFAENEETTRRMMEETAQRVVDGATERLEGQIRHTQVMVEDVRSDVKLVAEGVGALNQKVDRLQGDNERARREDRAYFTALFRDVQGRMAEHGLH